MIIMWCDKGSTTTMTIILPYTNVANQHVVPLKLMQCYVRYISEKKIEDRSFWESDLKDGAGRDKYMRNDDNDKATLVNTMIWSRYYTSPWTQNYDKSWCFDFIKPSAVIFLTHYLALPST